MAEKPTEHTETRYLPKLSVRYPNLYGTTYHCKPFAALITPRLDGCPSYGRKAHRTHENTVFAHIISVLPKQHGTPYYCKPFAALITPRLDGCQRMAEKPTKRTENHFLPLRCKAFVIECKVYANLSPIKVKFV